MNTLSAKRVLLLALLCGLLIGCVSYHQPRYGSDGVYFDQRYAAPRQVVVVDPMFYPYWSLDFFYFSRFHRPYRSPFFVHSPWFYHDPWFYSRRGWASSAVWSHPVVYTAPPVDQRLWLMQQDRSTTRQARQTAWGDPGSEVQLRHRLAEDRAAAARRESSSWRASASSSATSERMRQPAVGHSPRSSQSRSTAPTRQAPVSRTQPQQRSRELRSQGSAAREQRSSAPASLSPTRDRQIER
jgi:hypothetical protein